MNDLATPLQPLADLPHMGGLDDSPRGRILRAAAYLFRQQGYAKTTVRELAQVVGILSGSLFHHFKSKDDILLAVMYEAICYNTQRMRDAVKLGNTTQKLRALIRAELEAINGDTGAAMAVLVFEWSSINAVQQAPLLAMREDYEKIWLDVLKQAHTENTIAQPPMMWRRLIGGAIAWTVTWYKPEGKQTLDDLTEMLLNMGVASSQ